MLKRLLLFLGILSLLACGSLLAGENIEDDLSGFETIEDTSDTFDALEGFDDIQSVPHAKSGSSLPVPHAKPKKSNTSLSGNLAFKTSLGYIKHEVDSIEYSGINQAQTSLYLQLDSKLNDNWKLRVSGDAFYDAIYDIHKDNDYRDEILDDYKTQLRFDDVYLQGKISPSLDAKIGRQIVVWGKSDNIRVTDVINPIDNRQPGMTDIEDLRLSVAMAKFDYYLGMWNLSFMAIAENRIMLEATPRGEFFAVDALFASSGTSVPDPFLPLHPPAASIHNMQYAFAANGVFSGWDLSFYAANVLDQKWHFDKLPSPSTPLTSITREVSKINMLGSALNIVNGNWLYKSEIAFLNGVRYNTTLDEKNRLDALVGVEYMGFKDTVLSFELADRHIFEYENQMKDQADFVDEDEVQTALRATKSFANDTVDVTALLSMFGSSWQNGGFARVWMEYEIRDALSCNFGIVDYIGGGKPLMESNKDNDRVFADIKYSF
ncbi:DUF1302 family protein [bacterium]|nr:DUF1302 family protein [bacterium]MBU1990156.1 DUF1302 family protein [bacterium]